MKNVYAVDDTFLNAALLYHINNKVMQNYRFIDNPIARTAYLNLAVAVYHVERIIRTSYSEIVFQCESQGGF